MSPTRVIAEMKKEQEGGKKYLGGRQVKKKKNSYIVNKGPCSSYHEIHRPALLLLVSSPFHNCLLTLGGKQGFVENMRDRPGAKDRNWNTISFIHR